MNAIATPIWNQIAATQELRTQAAKVAFDLDEEAMQQMLDLWADLEQKAGTPMGLASSLQTFLPLLVENSAIQQFVSQNKDLATALPEVLTAKEATMLATMDHRLDPQEQSQLQALLAQPQAVLQRWEKAARISAKSSMPLQV
jgi:hypothetical protein